MTLTTERVPARRRGPLAVSLLLLALVALLVARPWHTPAPSPSPLAVAEPSPGLDVPTASQPATADSPQPQPQPTPLVLPTPDIAPVGPIGDVALATAADKPLVECTYSRSRRGRVLTAVEVQPPTVFLDASSSPRHIRRIGWRFEIETSDVASPAERDWVRADGSRWQVAAAFAGRPAAFAPLSAEFSARGVAEAQVVRARMIVEWYTRNDEVAGQAELIPTRYREGDAPFAGTWPTYCRAVI